MPFDTKGPDFNPIILKMNKAVNNAFDDSGMKKIGEFAKEKIRIRTQLGRSTASHGAKEIKFKKLKESTVKSRERLKKDGKLSKNTSPRRSNLTATGQMLDAMFVTDVSGRKKEVSIDIHDGRDRGDIGNFELVVIHEQGKGRVPKRPFFFVSGKQRQQLIRLASTMIKKEFDKIK